MDVAAGQDQPEPIADGERLGRHEWSETSAKKAYRQLKLGKKANIRANKFEPRTGHNDVSVDRMDLAADEDELAKLAEENTTREGKLFRGWYTLTAHDVAEAGCRARPTPLSENPYHADIVFPVALNADNRQNEIRKRAIELAYRALYVPWGDWQDEVTIDKSELPSTVA
ncbi:MAG: hypothetical protein OXF56_14445 [Rhodobacteraceae bacterium]|nr:hypothetical protein [Paracoccaceae bacterium]